jgi:arylformamidase
MIKYIDLTRPFHEKSTGFSRSGVKYLDSDGWNASEYVFYSHAGTHMDAPIHFGAGNAGIDAYQIQRFFVKCHVVRLPNPTPRQLIYVKDIPEAVLQKVKPGDGLLIHTNWSQKYGSDDYRNALPRISDELADWICAVDIKFIGVEPPSIADVNNIEEVGRIHRKLLKANVIIVEGLVNLEKISHDVIDIIALPLCIRGGDGAPARVIAIETES